MASKTCFVIIGFGPKVDYATARTLDLDKTFENLIKPVFDELGIKCLRANGIKRSGIIDEAMYEWIYKADIVVADISTLNANALYELGVRHALRPHSTIVISEDKLKYPFDVDHITITKYEHLGTDIGVSESKRFKKELKSLVEEILKSRKRDSPIYTFLPNLKPPTFEKEQPKVAKPKSKTPLTLSPTISELVNDAEKLKNENNFTLAAQFYKVCLRDEPNNIFLMQRLALVTYKAQKPNPPKALLDAERILKPLNPETTTDPETLGLSGAINKRLYELTKNKTNLEKAIAFYAKGFNIQQDYYNGINYAYLLTLKSTITRKKNEAISYFMQANRVREEIILICNDLINKKNFKGRGDKEWIYQTLAQAFLGLNKPRIVKKLLPTIEILSKGNFDKDTFYKQNKKLTDNIKIFRKRHKI